MKNKSKFFVKLICLISIIISISVFVVMIINLEDTKVKLASIKKVNIKGQAQEEIVKPGKIEIPELVLDNTGEENDENGLPQVESEIVEEVNKQDEISEENNTIELELTSENCEYSINSETNTVDIDEYAGSVDCIIIPSEIDGKKVENVNTENFADCSNLETIKISKEISEQINEIPNFELNEELEEENYVVYTTTREYGEAYKGYLELSEEERKEIDFIPPKYEIPLEIDNQNGIKNLQAVGSVEINETYDLRDDIKIKVENQNPYGICYAYSSFTAAETFWSLNNNESLDFSEVHAAILTSGSGGSTFLYSDDYYASKLGPVYEEEYPMYGVRSNTLTNATAISNCISSDSPSSYSSVQSTAKTEIPVKYITTTKQFPTITQSYKQNSLYDSAIESTRNDIKKHIKTYGALAAVVNSDSIQEYNGKMVENDQSTSAVNHAVTIIGWDDNFDVSNFPSSSRPSKNGAYLVLNSWGSDWGNNGCYWVSYEDKWIEYYLIGVTAMTEASENLQASSMIVTDQETGETLDNGFIEDGTKIKIEVEATITSEISGENIEVSLRDNTTDYTSYMTVSGTDLIDNKANFEILLDTEEIKGEQYILEISYGTETISKMIETSKEFNYSVNADGTISIIAYTGNEKEIVIPAEYDGYKVSTIAKDAFMLSGIEKVTIEEGITTIAGYAFRSSDKLTEINLPRTLTSIGEGAFLGCSSLKQLIIPRSVTTLGAGIVQGCTNLKEIVIFKETTSIGGSMIYNTPNATIYCEASSTALSYAQSYSYSYSIITESYNITYNKNAGTDTVTNMPTTQNKVKYDTITMSSNIPVRSGYKFLGWATSASATEVEYLPGDDYRTDASLSLYAVWEATEKEISYTIEYYKDGVKEDEETISKKVDISETAIAVDKTGINTTNKYLGYAFEKTEPSVIPDTASDGDIIKVYYTLETYSITYELNDGTLADGNKNPESYSVKDTFTLNNPEKEGYTFIGWTGSNGNTPETSVTVNGETGNKNYIANYEINNYTITYDLDGGSITAGNNPENYTINDTFTLNNPEKEGYTFTGWTGSNGNTPEKTVTIAMGTIGDKTYTANYAINSYTVTYKVDSEIYGEVETYEYGQSITPREEPTKTGYKFSGWSKVPETMPSNNVEITGTFTIDDTQTKELSYTVEYYKDNVKQDTDTENEKTTVHVLEADTITVDKSKINTTNKYVGYKFEKTEPTEIPDTVNNGDVIKVYYTSEIYTITYDLSEGTLVNEKTNPEYYTVNDSFTLNTPEKTGYTFTGWTGSNGEEPQKTITIEKGTTGDKNYKANFTINTYTVTYDLDDGSLEEGNENPAEFTVNDSFVLENPEKEGYTFIGWTGSNGDTPEKTVTIAKGTTGNKNYTANYTVNSYTVTYKVDGEIYGEVETYEYGQTITPREEPAKTGYKFSGWGEIPETMPAKNVELEGIFYIDGTQLKELSYTVEYYKDNIKQDADTETEKTIVQVLEPDTLIVDKDQINTTNKYVGYKFEKTEPAEIPDTVNNGDVMKVYYTVENYTITYNLDGGNLQSGKENPTLYTVNDSFVLETPEKEGYTFTGWTGSNGEEPEKTVTIAKGTTGNKEYNANYSIKTYKLTIRYIYDNDSKYTRIYEGEFKYGENYAIQTPEIDGYTSDLEIVSGQMSAKDTTIDVHYIANTDTKYVVEHYKQNIADNDYALFETEECTGTTDTETLAVPKEYEGFTAQEITQENIEGDESTIVKIYYDRNKYTITYFEKISETDGYIYIDSQEYKYEEQITPIEYLESYGKKFSGWSEVPETMPASDVDVYGEFSIDETQTKELKYTVEYYKNGIKQETDTQTEKTTVQVLESDEINVDKTKINTTNKYVGYEFYNTNSGEIPEVVNSGTVIKVYYIPIVYTITYDLDNGNLTEENPKTYTIEDEVKLNNPEKEGYTFIGWTGSNGEEPEKTVTIEKGTTSNKEYKANYTINSYTLTYKVDGEVYGDVETYEYKQAITPREEPTKRGYIFSGWSEIPEIMPANDVEITGTFTIDETQTKELSYTVEYYKNNVKQDDDTETEKVIVLEFESDEITVNKEKVNIQDRYAGYTFEKTEPAEIPETLNNGDVIKVYYIANKDTKYTVEHYKQNILDDNYTVFETEESAGTTDTLTVAEAKEYEGFTSKEFTQENIAGNGNTIVKIYYDRNKYTLTYKVDGEIDGEVEIYKYEEEITPRENPVKLGYRFSGWTEIPETMPANNLEASGTFIFDETQTKELSYTVEYYKDNVKQEADTQIEKATVQILEPDEMIVNKEKINIQDKYEGCILDSTLTSIPDKVISGDVIKVYYVRKEAKVNVEYRDFVSGEEISEKVVKTAKVYDTYDISEDKKEIEGYTFIEGPEELTGEYTEEEQTKVYKYAKNSKVTVNYIEKASGETIAEPVIIDGYETKDYETEEKTIENYILIETPENKTGKMTKEEITVNYYYIHVSEGVIERHIDITTNEVLKAEVYQGNEGDSYKTESKTFEGYTLVEDRLPSNAEGTMTDEAIIVEYFYIRIASVKVQYVDKISNEILLEEKIEGFENDTYETEEKEFEGYELVERPTNANGNMTVTKDENNNAITETTVIYYYKKISEGVIERHYDIKNNELLEEVVHSGLEGDSYKVEPKEFDGYDIVEDRMPTNAEGIMAEEKIEVNYYYIRKTTVRVEYIDIATNEKIIEDVIINNHEGNQYKAERKEFEQYIMLEDRLPENEEGTITVSKDESGNVTTETVVKYYYVRKATVKVEYINKETGEKISEDTVIEGYEGKDYKAEPKEIEGYNLLEENENTEGIMAKEEIIAKFYYEKIVSSEEYLINEDDIKKITVGTTISDLKENIATKENYVILDIEGKEVSENEVIKTGMKLKLEDGKEYDLIVRGDLNCDGNVSLTDLSRLILHYNEMRGFILTGSPCKAADMNYDNKITLTDISQMLVFYNSI